MRRISADRKKRLIRLALRRWARSLGRRGKFSRSEVTTIVPPSVLSFKEDFVGTMKFLNDLREATQAAGVGRNRVDVDMTVVKRITVPVSVVLAAEFHRWSLRYRKRIRPINQSLWNPQVKAILTDLGVFELLGVAPPKGVNFDAGDNFTITPLLSGQRHDGARINRLQAQFGSVVEGFVSRKDVFEGLQEAVDNTISHAYDPSYKPKFAYAGHRWWAASCVDLGKERLRFFIFDQGAGIPFTLPRSSLYEGIRSWLAEKAPSLAPDDAYLLEAAFEVGRTRTGLTHRGLGLRKMTDVVRGFPTAYLRILSGRAELNHDDSGKIVKRSLPHHIGGTLIEWNMPVRLFTSDDEDESNARD